MFGPSDWRYVPRSLSKLKDCMEQHGKHTENEFGYNEEDSFNVMDEVVELRL